MVGVSGGRLRAEMVLVVVVPAMWGPGLRLGGGKQGELPEG